ncbi:MAG: hypothetical protein IPJ77_01685 [Planctomycetes bacterium]|nr:hypothetical protein [Planctomycetota bacterium]
MASALAALLVASCSTENAANGPEFFDPFLGAVPELRSAAVSVVMLPGMSVPDPDEVEPQSDGLDELEFALWESGDAIWLEPSDSGPASHRYARLAPGQVAALVAELKARIASTARREVMVFDTSHEQICVRTKGRELLLVSCHELFESNPNLVALSYGIAPLEGRTREDALAKEPAEFLAFRQAWSDAKQAIRAALPKDGDLVDRAQLATLGLK